VRVLKDIRYDAATHQYLVLVAWLGFDSDDDSWEPLSVMNEDFYRKVAQFFGSPSKQSLLAEARLTL
jgi:Chromo (CHRromatin Organisation MOdifier) domain